MDDDASEIPCDSADSTPDSTPASSENDSNVWSQYEFDFRSKGKMLTCCKNEFLAAENYLRGCKWSPDGTCLLTCSNDNRLRLFNLPESLYTELPDEQLPEMKSVVSVCEGEMIYDFCWFPLMSSNNHSTCCFASTSRGSPVHLYDAYTGAIRCSYSAYNHLDELVSPHSIAFNADGSQLYTGFKNCVRVHDTSRPGRTFSTVTLYDKKNGGQKGIISSIDVNRETLGMYALGGYSASIGVYSDQVKGPIFLFHSLSSGVTQVLFSSCGKFLFSGERKSKDLLCWDLRKPNSPLLQFSREVKTNQRIYFDLDRFNRFLCSGGTNGSVTFWDMTLSDTTPSSTFIAHNDAVNGCSIHPWRPLLATSSGQWTFDLSCAVDSDNSSCDEQPQSDRVYENCVRLWSFVKANE